MLFAKPIVFKGIKPIQPLHPLGDYKICNFHLCWVLTAHQFWLSHEQFSEFIFISSKGKYFWNILIY